MKAIAISALLISLAAPVAAVELPNFGTGSRTVRVKSGKPGSIPDTPITNTPEIDGSAYSNPIDREIAIATYEFTHGDMVQAFERLEKVLPDADPSRRVQIESQLFLNYLKLSLLPYPERSEKWLKRAAVLKPDDPRPYRELREIYCYTRKFNLCKQAHREAVKRSPDEVFELQLLATTLEETSEFNHALVVLRAAIEAEREKAKPDLETIEIIKVQMQDVVKLSR